MSPRQKMINLMYLVFIAMMALSMGKEVLTAFGSINEKLTENNTSTTQKNEKAYSSLNTKANDQPAKYLPLKNKADIIKQASSKLNVYIDSLKANMMKNQEDAKDYEVMDRADFLNEHFFKGDVYTEKGTEFVNEINNYRTNVVAALGSEYKNIANTIANLFNTDDQTNREGISKKWLNYHFEEFPLVASLTKLTQIQVDIKNSENNILTTMLGGQLESEVALSNYKGIVQLDKTAYYVGEKVTGKVVPLTATVSCPGTLTLKLLTFNCKSKTKSGNPAPISALAALVFGILTTPKSPLAEPIAAGISLILNVFGELTTLPLLKVAFTFTVISLPLPGLIIKLDPFGIILPPVAVTFKSLLLTPGKDTETGLSTPRYTTFIASAEITASFGSGITV